MDLFEQQLQNEIPAFLHNEIVFCDKYLQQRKQYFIALARNLKFYKFRHKQLINCIDLKETCLNKVAQNIRDYKGPKGKCFKSSHTRSGECIGGNPAPTKHGGLMETVELQSTNILGEEETNADANVSFGKYIYRNFDINKIYFLIHCWDKLVVLDYADYTLVAEYESVKHFRIVHGKVKFTAILELHFENGSTLCTDFQTNDNMGNHQENNDSIASTRSNFRQMLERVRCAKAELQLHKSTTQKDFDILRDFETHGCNFIRSVQLEEKPMITRCGDIWIRFVTNSTLVLGVPLVNNCSANSLTLLKNLKPILKTNAPISENIFYNYRLYQLSANFEDLETMETFFQTEDVELKTNEEQRWVESKCTQLLPGAFGVLLIAVRTAQICLLEKCPLFLYYEIEKALAQKPAQSTVKTRIHEQHVFLKNLNITDLLMNREKYALSLNSLTCQQDFLACAMLNKETTLRIEFQTRSDAILFEQLICKNFNFKTLERNLNLLAACDISHAPAEQEIRGTTQAYIATGICFNNDPTSLWFGSMVVKTMPCMDEEAIQVWKLYLYDKEKAFVCLKSLFNELSNCAIKNIKHFVKKPDDANSHYLRIKKLLTTEIEYLKSFNKCDDAKIKKSIFIDLLKAQTDSDALIVNV